jgi:hypothetical protein
MASQSHVLHCDALRRYDVAPPSEASVTHSNTYVGCRNCNVTKLQRSKLRQRIHQCCNVFIVLAAFGVVPAQAKGCEMAAQKHSHQ